ncbi:MAG: hypothetical protein ACKVHO_13585, partial [Verrucomicrobiia bacterium]
LRLARSVFQIQPALEYLVVGLISSVGLTHHKEQLRFSQSVLASVRPLLNEPCVAAISFS